MNKQTPQHRVTPRWIDRLEDNQIFVFGSNLAGMHGGGAARQAMQWGAVWGEGVGLHGQTYAIPTMHGGVQLIQPYVDEFLLFTQTRLDLEFLVTEIGCGIAGFKPGQMAPLFKRAWTGNLENVFLPLRFVEALEMENEPGQNT